MSELYNRLCKVQTRNPYLQKDLGKAKRADQFIGYGAPNSSTEAYRLAAGDLANTGIYTPTSKVFISVNGNRPNAVRPPYDLIKKAIEARAILITDNPSDRSRSFNTGERSVAIFLGANDYFEAFPGVWCPNP